MPPRAACPTRRGGTYVLANLHGGGEYGKAWHDGGRLANKQNVFGDFIAGEYLKAQGIASPKGLAIEGGSNGGLLIGAVVNPRPDLFDAAHPAVGVMDMPRSRPRSQWRAAPHPHRNPGRPWLG